jgi:hypothetical protein
MWTVRKLSTRRTRSSEDNFRAVKAQPLGPVTQRSQTVTLTSRGIAGGDLIDMYHFQYEDSLEFSGIEPNRTFQTMTLSLIDFNILSSWFREHPLDVTLPIDVNVTQNSNSASWNKVDGKLTITLNPGTGSYRMVRYLLAAEMVEQLMRAQNGGWFGIQTEGSMGEGLSQFLAAQFVLRWWPGDAKADPGLPPPTFEYSNVWLASNRMDFINSTDRLDSSKSPKSGCALLFIYYLFTQLGHSIDAIIAAAAPTLAGVYSNLTGDPNNPFPRFKQIVDHSFPGTSFVTSGNLDNPFPLPTP